MSASISMNKPGIVTLTTDFGTDSPYVAEMKGAMLCINASIQIIDATHSIEPQNVLQGALCLRQYAHRFPDGTIHVAVVDPGVGTRRQILLVQSGSQHFIGPDNGLLTFALEEATSIRVIDNEDFFRQPVSATFHGRDIMGPAAAHLCNGVQPEQLGAECDWEPVKLSVGLPSIESSLRSQDSVSSDLTIVGKVLIIDSFGNVITNISSHKLAGLSEVCLDLPPHNAVLHPTYGNVAEGTLMCLIGSSGWLEVAVNGGNAARQLGIEVGQPVRFSAKRNTESVR